jgi:hypothetical protein
MSGTNIIALYKKNSAILLKKPPHKASGAAAH